MVGSHNTLQPSAEFFGTAARSPTTFRAATTATTRASKIPSPTNERGARQDRTDEDFRRSVLLSSTTRRASALLFGTYNGKFQIPTNPNQPAGSRSPASATASTGCDRYPSTAVNQNQREVNRFVVVSFQKKPRRLQLPGLAVPPVFGSAFPARSRRRPGVQRRRFGHVALQLGDRPAVRRLARSSLRPYGPLRRGLYAPVTHSNNSVSVFAVDADGAQILVRPVHDPGQLEPGRQPVQPLPAGRVAHRSALDLELRRALRSRRCLHRTSSSGARG